MIFIKMYLPSVFLLTRLLRGVTEVIVRDWNNYGISTHTPLARRDKLMPLGVPEEIISTHTPLARRDLAVFLLYTGCRISTHTPLARRDNRNTRNQNIRR